MTKFCKARVTGTFKKKAVDMVIDVPMTTPTDAANYAYIELQRSSLLTRRKFWHVSHSQGKTTLSLGDDGALFIEYVK